MQPSSGRTELDSWDLWDADVATGIFSRLTTHPGLDSDPAWSPDERALAFCSMRLGRFALFLKDLARGTEEPLVAFDDSLFLDQWTPDGRFVIARTFAGPAVYAIPLDGDRKPRLLVDIPTGDELHVSPDGRWVAFNAPQSGRWEVYVAAFLAFTSRRQISEAGGVQPLWRADGRELFYLAPDGSMMNARVETHSGLTVSPASRLFSTRLAATPYVAQYAVTGDGQRFLGIERATSVSSFTFLVNRLEAATSQRHESGALALRRIPSKPVARHAHLIAERAAAGRSGSSGEEHVHHLPITFPFGEQLVIVSILLTRLGNSAGGRPDASAVGAYDRCDLCATCRWCIPGSPAPRQQLPAIPIFGSTHPSTKQRSGTSPTASTHRSGGDHRVWNRYDAFNTPGGDRLRGVAKRVERFP